VTRRLFALLPIVGVAIALAIALPLVRRQPHGEPLPSGTDRWEEGLRFPVRVVDGDLTYDVEITDYPSVGGRVAYEGPARVEGEENWKPVHDYRGVDLLSIVEDTAGLENVETLTVVALDGWNKTLPGAVLCGGTACGRVILALSVDGEPPAEWADAPVLVFLPEDERFGNQDMLDALGPDLSHYFGAQPSSTGLMVKGVVFLVVNYDGGSLPSLADL